MPSLAPRAIAAAILGLVLIVLVLFGASQCTKRKNAASQARVEQSQAQAAQESAKDAINAVAASGARESASEDLTRSNDREIRAADGASERVGAGVNYAGRAALCRREAYRNDPKCRGVGQ